MDEAIRAVCARRRSMKWLAWAAALTLALLAAHAPAAAAGGVPTMTAVELEHLPALAEWAYRNGATVTAPGCGDVCSDLWLSEHRPMPNQPTSDELWGELNQLEESSTAEDGIALTPSLDSFVVAFSPYAQAIALGGASFELGWHIGGQIDKWLGISVPAKPASVNADYLQWFPKGETYPFLTYHETMTMPFSGFAVVNNSLAGVVASRVEGPLSCNNPGPSSYPDGFVVLRWWWNDCFAGYLFENPLFPVTAIGLVAQPSTFVTQPPQDYTGQSSDATTEGLRDPGTEVVERRLQEALESGDYPLLNQWLDHQLGGSSEDPLCEPVSGARSVKVPAILPGETIGQYESCLDTLGLTEHVRVTVPVGQAVLAQPARGVVGVEPAEGTSVSLESETQVQIKINPDPLPEAEELEDAEECDRSTPTYPVEAPPNDPTAEAFDQITDASLVASPTFPSTRGNTLLRWGAAEYVGLVRGRPNYSGWGYQHIKAKHGWSRADDTDTRSALETTPHPSDNENGTEDSFEYFGPQYSQNGLTCVRVVLVDYGTASGDPGPKGIITSYGADGNTVPKVFIP